MYIRLGYVAIALQLNITTSQRLTYAKYQTMDKDDRLAKLIKITKSNLQNLYQVLLYNIANNICFYRITSSLIPLATHPSVLWDYEKYISNELKAIGHLVKQHNIRLDCHPSEFDVINSINQHVVDNTLIDLQHHNKVFELMGYPEGKMIIHVGSAHGGKEESMARFINNFAKFPKEIKDRILIENDDKTFTAKEVLWLCQSLGVPMVLDVHHHNCNNDGENIESLMEDIFATWNNEKFPPKLHFSSPHNIKNPRKHADFINSQEFLEFIEKCKLVNRDIDIMLESKQKDLALFQLIGAIKNLKSSIRWENPTTLRV